MTIGYYIIPTTDPPYSVFNPKAPKYLDDLKCDSTGHNLDKFGVYICAVITTDEKHKILCEQKGALSLPGWDDPLSKMDITKAVGLAAWLDSKGLAFDSKETTAKLLHRMLACSLLGLTGREDVTTSKDALTISQKSALSTLCTLREITVSSNDTIRTISDKIGEKCWNGPQVVKAWGMINDTTSER